MTRSKTLHCVFERDKGMREVDVNEIIKNIKEMCIEANHFLSKDMKEVYDAAAVEEESPLGRQILGQLQDRKSTRLNSSHNVIPRMPSSA